MKCFQVFHLFVPVIRRISRFFDLIIEMLSSEINKVYIDERVCATVIFLSLNTQLPQKLLQAPRMNLENEHFLTSE